MRDWSWEIRRRLASLKLPPAREAEIVEEVGQHLEDRYQELVASGATEEEALRLAVEELRDGARMERELRSIEQEVKSEPVVLGAPQKRNIVLDLWQDLHFGLRQLRRSPGFTAVAVITLALGIGANTAIFSVINAVFLRPLPFPHASRIHVVARVGNQIGGFSISLPIFLAWQKEQGLFDHLALLAWRGDSTLSGEGEPERIPSAGASTELFSLLGVQPAVGRDFRPEEGRPGGANVVILSDAAWRNRFGQDKTILGRTITLNQDSYTIIGVLPPGFEVPVPWARNAELWLPVHIPLTSNNPSNGDILCVGLLKSNVTPAQAGAALTPPLAELRREFPSMFTLGERAYLVPLRDFLADWAGPAPLLLLGAVALVLLIACANVANLTLARSTTRQREMAIRTAIGAGRGRIVRQLLTESVLLALLGGIFGVLACYTCFSFVVALVPAELPHIGALQMDRTALLFALLLSLITGVVFGLAPALGASRVDLNASLKEASLQLGLGGRGRLRNILAASEVSITLVLLIGAVLAFESFAGLMRVRPGFDPHNLLSFGITLPAKKYDTRAKRAAFFSEAVTRISALPGLERAALVSVLPLEEGPDTLFSIEGAASQQPSEILGAVYRVITPGYFGAMRIPVLRGRTFSDSDNNGAEPVAVINQTMAKRYWPHQDALGQRIWIGKPMGPANAEPAPRQIVGIVSDIHEMTLAEPPVPTVYMPYAQRPQEDQAFFVLRTRQTPLSSLSHVRSAMRGVDADLPLAEIKTMEQVLSASLTDWRFHAILLGAFGSLALFISSIGIYGVISYSVAQRTHEMGVRMALGAARRDVVKLVLGQGLRLALAGIAIGLVGAWALTRFLTSLLFGIKPTDPLTFVGVCLILTIVAVLASYLPARRATKVDPIVALRYE
jgi:putative ABC transport system permease protein